MRWFPFARADGAFNMAADDVLLQAAVRGTASLRFYGWSGATVSLGYFQPAASRCGVAGLAQLPWVRRPTGGKTLVHHHELTYALALPPGFAPDWMPRMHRAVILPALCRFGLSGRIEAASKETELPKGGNLCFQEQTPGDLMCAGHKVAGSAQRKHHGALLQHGAILLAQSTYAPLLPGIKELTGVDLLVDELQAVVVEMFRKETGWETSPVRWTAEEEKEILAKVTAQYGTAEWKEKR